MTEFRQRVAECNACIPYSGIASGARVEDSAFTAVLSLLPVDPPTGANPPPPGTLEAIRSINILHCLQRLVTSPAVAAAVLQTPGLSLCGALYIEILGSREHAWGFVIGIERTSYDAMPKTSCTW